MRYINGLQMKIAIASDHAGYELKQEIVKFLQEKESITVIDFGTDSPEQSVDYPDFAGKVAKSIQNNEAETGILLCGTGVGISISANKYKGIRAALCHDAYTARMSRTHNNANVLAMGGRTTGKEIAFDMVEIWLSSKFEGGRHKKRVQKIHNPEC